MPFLKDETEETKNRIISVAKRQFAEKGFDATRVDEIAKEAGVNKALIYYYFQSKEAILDHLIKTLFDEIYSIAMEFVQNNIVARIKGGLLDIQEDRWCFASDDAAQDFRNDVTKYYEYLVDFTVSHRSVIRILVFESLKNGKHHNDLFHMFNLLYNKDDNSIYKTIWNADPDFSYSLDDIVFKFFFGLTPLLNFAAYFDDYLAFSGLSETELRDSFIHTYHKMSSVFLDGKDFVL